MTREMLIILYYIGLKSSQFSDKQPRGQGSAATVCVPQLERPQPIREQEAKRQRDNNVNLDYQSLFSILSRRNWLHV